MKKCPKCNLEKNLSEYHNSKATKDGKVVVCKSCIKIYSMNYRSRDGFKKKKQEQDKNYQQINKDKLRENRKAYDAKYPNRQKEYNQKNLKNNNITQKKRYYSDVNHKLRKQLSTRIISELKGKIKSKKTVEILGCSFEKFKKHLESKFLPEMSWENHGIVWEIDHIKPCALFDFTIEENILECFHYTNHQPLFKTTEIAESFGYINHIGNRNKNKTYDPNKN